MRPHGPLALLIAYALLGAGPVWGADLPEATRRPTEPAVTYTSNEDPDPGTPRGAVKAFLDACRVGDYRKASDYLGVASVPHAGQHIEGAVLARRLKVVLDQKLWVDLEELSDRPEGREDDGLRPEYDRVGTIRTKEGDVDVLLRRMDGGPGGARWKIAPSTVRRIPALYDEFGYGSLGEILPGPLFETRFLQVELWQWIGLAVLLLLALVLSRILIAILHRAISPFTQRSRTDLDDKLLALAARPAGALIALLLFALGTQSLRLSVPVHRFLAGLEKGLGIVLMTWLLLRLADVLADVTRQRLEAEGRRSLAAIIPLGRRSAKVVLMILAGIVLLQNLGFNVTGLVAGLGVGGLAVALAAQKTLENLFGGVTVTADQPVRVGDFCRFGDKSGTVEDVGLRSTRIRTLDRTLISVPNSEFAQVQIENFAVRDRIRLNFVVGLRYETSPDQLRLVLTEFRRLLVSHPRVLPDPARVRLVGFGAHSFDIEVFAYVATQDFNEFLSIREDLLLRIMDILTASGTGLAFPSQTLYLGRDPGMSDTRTQEAERTVRAWREAGQLPFPDLPPEQIAGLRDTLDYPPRGSAQRAGSEPTPPGGSL